MPLLRLIYAWSSYNVGNTNVQFAQDRVFVKVPTCGDGTMHYTVGGLLPHASYDLRATGCQSESKAQSDAAGVLRFGAVLRNEEPCAITAQASGPSALDKDGEGTRSD
jgi:hypothetical protein